MESTIKRECCKLFMVYLLMKCLKLIWKFTCFISKNKFSGYNIAMSDSKDPISEHKQLSVEIDQHLLKVIEINQKLDKFGEHEFDKLITRFINGEIKKEDVEIIVKLKVELKQIQDDIKFKTQKRKEIEQRTVVHLYVSSVDEKGELKHTPINDRNIQTQILTNPTSSHYLRPDVPVDDRTWRREADLKNHYELLNRGVSGYHGPN